jgi:hypothetical protein
MDHGRQHWVPSSYLEAWCDPDRPPQYDPYVWIFPKYGGRGQRKAPRNIFAETDFYTIRVPDGSRDLSLEHGLSSLETKFSRVRESRIEKRLLLSAEEKVGVCAFLAAMHFRTRAQRNAFRQQWGRALRVAEDLHQGLNAMTPKRRKEYRPPTVLGEGWGPSLSIAQVRELSERPLQQMLPNILESDLPILARMNLVIFTTDDAVGFATSDHPCVWFDEKVRRGPLSLRSKTIEVSMPVSPRSLALLCWEDLPSYKNMSLPELENANRLQQANCDEYLVVCREAIKSEWFT